MSKRGGWFLFIGVILYLVVVAGFAFQRLNQVPDLNSSPTQMRTSLQFRDGHFGVFEPTKQSVDEDWPATAVMSEPTYFPGRG
ncbi:MAG: hypothetical protein KDN20_21555, partial [Verrucomicrobiae bacterium]|nr:hypothetical protein [Verrucomicrobiae bacterium]